MLGILGASALVPAALAAAALVTLPPEEGTTEEENPVGAFIGATALAWFPLMALPRKLRAERDTPAGQEAAARWLGLRDHLDATGGFAEAPPLLATAIGLAGLLGGLFVARIFFPLMADAVSDLFESTREEGFSPVNLLAIAILALPTIVPAVLVVRSALMLAAAVPDLFVTREVQGVVLRIRHHEKVSYLAVDEGAGTKVRAWIVAPLLLNSAGLNQGRPVSATVTPRLGYVSRLSRIPDADQPA